MFSSAHAAAPQMWGSKVTYFGPWPHTAILRVVIDYRRLWKQNMQMRFLKFIHLGLMLSQSRTYAFLREVWNHFVPLLDSIILKSLPL